MRTNMAARRGGTHMGSKEENPSARAGAGDPDGFRQPQGPGCGKRFRE